MKRIMLVVSYDGTNYHGWQIQPGVITVESVLNEAVSRLTGEQIQVAGASRTDAGVHALGNVAVFDTCSRIPAEKFYYGKLNVGKMRSAAAAFIGEHDFAAFCSAGAQVKTTVRNIYAMEIEEEQAEGRIRIRVTGNGFLYNMVRIITGTLLEVGKGTLEPESVPQIIASCNRGEAGPTAPAKGLKLLSINFDTD